MPGFVWGFTHTSGGKGKREGTRTASHDQQRGNKRERQRRQETGKGAHNKQAEQRKENFRAGRRKHTVTQHWHAEEQTAQGRTGNKAKHSSETTEEGPKGRGKRTPEAAAKGEIGYGEGRGGRGGRRQGRKEGFIHGPTGGKEERCTQLYPSIQGRAQKRGRGVVRCLLFSL